MPSIAMVITSQLIFSEAVNYSLTELWAAQFDRAAVGCTV